MEFKAGHSTRFTQTVEDIETSVSEYNFDSLIDEVINNGEYADQEILKRAVSYRFIDLIGKGNPEYENEGLKLQREIVKHIVWTYNKLRRELGIISSVKEEETGLMEL